MPFYFRAVALDYDGTLTEEDRPAAAVLAALQQARVEGWRLILVTGRILDELLGVFPEAGAHFDAVVAENGALWWSPGRDRRLLAPPVSAELATVLLDDGVPVRRGQVLLATDGAYDLAVEHHIGRLGLEDQLVRNRGALMVLPPGVTKATGLRAALNDLGISYHNTITLGDAENDHSLLASCELGVAVSNAVPALRAHADLTLVEPDGAGVASFLLGPILRDEVRVHPSRWQVALGSFADGSAATIPGSQVNVLITGGSQSGKSCLAGLLAERLVELGYSVCLLDPEGDHLGLVERHEFLLLGGSEPAPPPAEIGRLLQHGLGSVIVDLALHSADEKRRYCEAMLRDLSDLRRPGGLPHWLIIDEAHQLLGRKPMPVPAGEPPPKGLCLVTYRPTDTSHETLAAMDAVVTMADERGDRRTALLAGLGIARTFTVDPRASTHVRHWHKYLQGELPLGLRFFFLDGRQPPNAAGNLTEFHHAVERLGEPYLLHHLRHGDFSRWVAEVLRDRELAAALAEVEHRLESQPSSDPGALRRAVLRAVESRFPPDSRQDQT